MALQAPGLVVSIPLLRFPPQVQLIDPRTGPFSPPSAFESLPDDLLHMVFKACPPMTRTVLARTSKRLAYLAVMYRHLYCRITTTPYSHPSTRDVRHACSDLDFIVYCACNDPGFAEELDLSIPSIIRKRIRPSNLRCTHCGWRGRVHGFATHLTPTFRHHIRLELTARGVIYSQEIEMLAAATCGFIVNDALRIQAQERITLQVLMARFRALIRRSWNVWQINGMLHLWNRQRARGEALATRCVIQEQYIGD